MSKQLDSVRNLARQFFGSDLSEDALWTLLLRHRCYGLLKEVSCPEVQRNSHRLNSSLNANNILTRYRYCAPLFEQLQNKKIPYAVHKGAVLSQALYKSPFVRQSGDVDLLICRDDTDQVKQLLLAEGFIQGRITDTGIVPFTRQELLYHAVNTHQLAPFVRKTENPLCPYINVDVNTDLLWGESEEKTDMSFVLSKTEQTIVCDVPLQKLTAEFEFIALCLHHYKDMNSLYLLYGRGMLLGHLCDIYDYLHIVAPCSSGVAEICDRLGVSSRIKTCIILSGRVFGTDDIVESYLCKLAGDDLSDRFGLKEQEYRQWEIPLAHRFFGNVREYLEQILSAEEKEKIRINQLIM